MLTLIAGLPEGVVGVEAHGKVTADDYEDVLSPAVEAARRESGGRGVRLLYVLGPELPHYTARAVREDIRLGLGHLRAWERVAVVGDAGGLNEAVHAFGWIMPGEVRVFGMDELDSARAWVTSAQPDGARFY